MNIQTIIERMKEYHYGYRNGEKIEDLTSRDQVLFGDPNQECTGIVVTCWASIEVIKRAIELQANLIIVHEALFWNHGDAQDWLQSQQNQTYLKKKELLIEGGIVVWRNHDYVHSGIPVEGGYADGIFYGLIKALRWESYQIKDHEDSLLFVLPRMTVRDVCRQWMDRLHLHGVKVIGDPDTIVEKVWIAKHIVGGDNAKITKIEKEGVDLVIAMELIDFTVSEYICDSSQLGRNKVLMSVGHFNTEEAGMQYLCDYLPAIIGSSISVTYVQSGDMYTYLTKDKINGS